MSEAILVTGGAGFIGSNLVERLLLDGHRAIVVDNFSRSSLANLEPFRNSANFTILEGDITDVSFLKDTLRRAPVSKIFHLAAVHYIPLCIAHPTETLQVNVVGTQALLEAMEGIDVASFVFTSTSDVYAPKENAFSEDDPLEPLDIHGISKLFCERLIAHAGARHPNTSFIVARLFNPYGPRETNPHVIPHILSEIRQGEVVRLGNTHPQRDFIYIDDVVDALVMLSNVRNSFDVFNIGTGIPSSVAEVVELICKLTGRPIRVVSDPERVRSADHDILLAQITKLKSQTRWSPKTSLRDGLERLLQIEGLPISSNGHRTLFC